MTETSLPQIRLRAVLVGSIEPATRPDGTAYETAINKLPVDRPIWVGPHGFADDRQADRKHHGGTDQAVHIYPYDHYASWRDELGADVALLQGPGAFGENLSTEGLTESAVHLGDILRIGQALLQVSQGRQPCWKLDARFGKPGLLHRVLQTGRSGWYFRVLESGMIGPGDQVTLLERPLPDWPVDRLMAVILGKDGTRQSLESLAGNPILSAGWRAKADGKLAKL